MKITAFKYCFYRQGCVYVVHLFVVIRCTPMQSLCVRVRSCPQVPTISADNSGPALATFNGQEQYRRRRFSLVTANKSININSQYYMDICLPCLTIASLSDLYVYSAPVGVRCIAINPFVCVQIPCGRGSVLLRRRYAMLCTSGFIDDVTFSCSGPYT